MSALEYKLDPDASPAKEAFLTAAQANPKMYLPALEAVLGVCDSGSQFDAVNYFYGLASHARGDFGVKRQYGDLKNSDNYAHDWSRLFDAAMAQSRAFEFALNYNISHARSHVIYCAIHHVDGKFILEIANQGHGAEGVPAYERMTIQKADGIKAFFSAIAGESRPNFDELDRLFQLHLGVDLVFDHEWHYELTAQKRGGCTNNLHRNARRGGLFREYEKIAIRFKRLRDIEITPEVHKAILNDAMSQACQVLEKERQSDRAFALELLIAIRDDSSLADKYRLKAHTKVIESFIKHIKYLKTDKLQSPEIIKALEKAIGAFNLPFEWDFTRAYNPSLITKLQMLKAEMLLEPGRYGVLIDKVDQHLQLALSYNLGALIKFARDFPSYSDTVFVPLLQGVCADPAKFLKSLGSSSRHFTLFIYGLTLRADRCKSKPGTLSDSVSYLLSQIEVEIFSEAETRYFKIEDAKHFIQALNATTAFSPESVGYRILNETLRRNFKFNRHIRMALIEDPSLERTLKASAQGILDAIKAPYLFRPISPETVDETKAKASEVSPMSLASESSTPLREAISQISLRPCSEMFHDMPLTVHTPVD